MMQQRKIVSCRLYTSAKRRMEEFGILYYNILRENVKVNVLQTTTYDNKDSTNKQQQITTNTNKRKQTRTNKNKQQQTTTNDNIR